MSISWLKKEGKGYLLSFLIPLLIAGGCYFALGIYWGSSRSVMASDSFFQFSNFYANFNNVLHGKQNILYTWNASLGLNYLSFISYYLGGLFTPLIFFFDNQNVPNALYLITLLKIGSSGLTFYSFARNRFSLNQEIQIALSVAYALMGFAMAHSELIMWFDAFIFLPLVILGIHRLFDKEKCSLLFVSYLLLFISNFYFGFMIGVFSFLYFLAQLIICGSLNKRWIFSYLRTSILAIISSMIMILPMFFDLQENGEKLSKMERIFTEDINAWSLILKNFVGAYDTTKYHSHPFVYIGLIPLVFALFFFTSKQISWREKMAYGIIILLLGASFYLECLNLFWQGFHSPNMFLFRYSFLFSFLVITLATRGLCILQKGEFNKLFGVFLSLFFSFGVAFFYNKNKFIGLREFIWTYFFLIIYLLLICVVLFWQKHKMCFAPWIFLLVMSLEAVVNTYGEFEGISRDWVYSFNSLYNRPYLEIKKLVESANKNEKIKRFRLENLAPVSANDSLNYGYSGINFFSSIRNRHSSKFLDQLGYKSEGTNLNIRYDNNTLLMDSLMGVKYNIDKGCSLDKYGFVKQTQTNNYRLYKNLNALPLGLKTSDRIYSIFNMLTDNLYNQRCLFNTLADMNESYFSFVEPKIESKHNANLADSVNKVTYQEITADISKVVDYKVKVPAKMQAYFSFFATDGDEIESSTATISVKGGTHTSEIGITGQYYHLGYYEKDQEVQFRLSMYGSKNVTVLKPRVLLFNTKNFENTVHKLKVQGVEFEGNGRKIIGETTVKENEKVLYTTIPYDKGWSAYVNGNEVKITPAQDAFVTLPLVKGKNKIELVFFPQGLKVGIFLFFGGITVFVASEWWRKKKLVKFDK
ncbi:MAG: YfhO family protein [Lactobacillales bacterium]|nr:YfhO family protein [Lactobacillales bacterium]